MLVYKVAVHTFDCHALSELLLQSTLPVLQLQLTSTEDTAEGKTLHLIFFITYHAFLKIIHTTILNTCYSLGAQHEDDSDMQ